MDSVHHHPELAIGFRILSMLGDIECILEQKTNKKLLKISELRVLMNYEALSE